jgi:hypothetical protein
VPAFERRVREEATSSAEVRGSCGRSNISARRLTSTRYPRSFKDATMSSNGWAVVLGSFSPQNANFKFENRRPFGGNPNHSRWQGCNGHKRVRLYLLILYVAHCPAREWGGRRFPGAETVPQISGRVPPTGRWRDLHRTLRAASPPASRGSVQERIRRHHTCHRWPVGHGLSQLCRCGGRHAGDCRRAAPIRRPAFATTLFVRHDVQSARRAARVDPGRAVVENGA